MPIEAEFNQLLIRITMQDREKEREGRGEDQELNSYLRVFHCDLLINNMQIIQLSFELGEGYTHESHARNCVPRAALLCLVACDTIIHRVLYNYSYIIVSPS